jgi:hypothetical protein
MLTAALAALLIQQAAGAIAWETPSSPSVSEGPAATAGPASPLPDWARADPYAWERSQCSPMIRKDASLELCQVRVRSELAAALGDRLPAGLSPEAIEGCRQVSNGVGGYQTTCAPVERTLNVTPAPVAEVCEERPTRNANGAVTFERQCQPASGAASRDGLVLRLNRD